LLGVTVLRLALLTDDCMDAYMEIVQQDYTDYYFFVYDVLLQRERTKVWLAIEGSKIVGLMLVYNDSMVQLRGSPEAVGFLLSGLRLENVEVEVPADCLDMVLAKFPVHKALENMNIMRLEKGKENLKIAITPERLQAENSEEVAQLMRESYPLMWSEMTAENVKVLTSPKETVLFGIHVEGKLVAFGSAMLTPNVGLVCWLATSERYRCRGYCSSILSALVREGLKEADFMAIHVLDGNSDAWQIYEKVGFKPYRSYVLLKT
jgi:GNAT superfamily N-acetyltransferase